MERRSFVSSILSILAFPFVRKSLPEISYAIPPLKKVFLSLEQEKFFKEAAKEMWYRGGTGTVTTWLPDGSKFVVEEEKDN